MIGCAALEAVGDVAAGVLQLQSRDERRVVAAVAAIVASCRGCTIGSMSWTRRKSPGCRAESQAPPAVVGVSFHACKLIPAASAGKRAERQARPAARRPTGLIYGPQLRFAVAKRAAPCTKGHVTARPGFSILAPLRPDSGAGAISRHWALRDEGGNGPRRNRGRRPDRSEFSRCGPAQPLGAPGDCAGGGGPAAARARLCDASNRGAACRARIPCDRRDRRTSKCTPLAGAASAPR